eukprot:GILJ01005284.1.p1 GENE.GILJ01005284.1~~GILJ01005284.1.p1  ORF type:complete len:487 (+),score=48.20 GILJ01005284.1:31-1491(+)
MADRWRCALNVDDLLSSAESTPLHEYAKTVHYNAAVYSFWHRTLVLLYWTPVPTTHDRHGSEQQSKQMTRSASECVHSAGWRVFHQEVRLKRDSTPVHDLLATFRRCQLSSMYIATSRLLQLLEESNMSLFPKVKECVVEVCPPVDFTRPAGSIHQLNWDKVCAISASPEGSGGVFFVDFQESGIVVLKSSATVAQEIYAVKLQQLLGIPCPDFRMIRFTEEEFTAARTKLLEMTQSDGALNIKISRALDRPFWVVMEYISGKSLEEFGQKCVNQCFNIADPSGVKRLNQFGRLIMFDAAVNNFDRVPVIWNNEGNARNIMLGVESGPEPGNEQRFTNLYAIDSRVVSISLSTVAGKDNMARYLNSVECFLKETLKVAQADSAVCSNTLPISLSRLVEFVERVSLHRFTHEQIQIVVCGLVDAARALSELPLTVWQSIWTDCASLVKEDWSGVWVDGLASVDVNFLLEVQRVVRTSLEAFQAEGQL